MALALSITTIGLLLWAAAFDVATRRIPNWLVGLVALAGLARLGLDVASGGGLAASAADLALTLGVFGLGAFLFQRGLFGGGDVKLMAAATLWLGAGGFGAFVAATALAGGALAVGFVAWLTLPRAAARTARPSLPYGVAIAAGGILTSLPLP